MEFEEVDYWEELEEIMDRRKRMTSTSSVLGSSGGALPSLWNQQSAA